MNTTLMISFSVNVILAVLLAICLSKLRKALIEIKEEDEKVIKTCSEILKTLRRKR